MLRNRGLLCRRLSRSPTAASRRLILSGLPCLQTSASCTKHREPWAFKRAPATTSKPVEDLSVKFASASSRKDGTCSEWFRLKSRGAETLGFNKTASFSSAGRPLWSHSHAIYNCFHVPQDSYQHPLHVIQCRQFSLSATVAEKGKEFNHNYNLA